MRRKPLYDYLLALALPALLSGQSLCADPLPPANQWLAENTVLAVELVRPQGLLDLATSPRLIQTVTASTFYQKASAAAKFHEFQQGVKYLEFRLGTDWQTAVKKLLGGGVSWGLTADGGSLLIVDTKDADLLNKLHETALEFAKAEAAKQGQADRVKSAEYRGVTGWSFGGGEAHAIVGSRLLLANKSQVLRAAIDLRKSNGKGLASKKDYQAACRSAGGATGRAYVNLASLKNIPNLQKALTEETNPMGALLLAGLRDAVQKSNWLGIRLNVDNTNLSLDAAVDGRPKGEAGPLSFAWPKLPDEGALPNLDVPRAIAGISLYRDLHAFYGAKDQLFAERSGGLIFFENMMGIFFSGRDLTDDVMAQPKPEIRVVVAAPKYDPLIGTPQVKLPAFAAVFRLRNPKDYADVVEVAWQKAVGLINVTRGQKAEAGLMIDRMSHGDTRYSVAYFAQDKTEDKKKLGMQYNFRPSLVKMGEYLVFSSSDALAEDLIDALAKEAKHGAKPVPGVNSLVEFHAGPLVSLLEANQETLVRHNMVEKGTSKEQAEAEIGALIEILKYVSNARLTLGGGNEACQASLNLKLNLPPPANVAP